MDKEIKVEFNLADYLSEYEMKNLAREVFREHMSQYMRSGDDAKRILSNSAYEIVSNILEDRHGMNLESHLEDKCMKIINDENNNVISASIKVFNNCCNIICLC